MKKILLVLLALICAGIVFLAIKGNSPQEIKTGIEISAPPSKVWSIIMDIDQWQDWSPIINSSEGKSAIGAELNITMMSDEEGKDGPKYNPVIIDLNEQKYFHWRANMLAGFVFTNEKILILEETATGTKLTHIETFEGLMAPLMASSVEKNVPAMLNSMNQALKELAEK